MNEKKLKFSVNKKSGIARKVNRLVGTVIFKWMRVTSKISFKTGLSTWSEEHFKNFLKFPL